MMKQLNNGFCGCYYLTEAGEIYNEQTNTYIKPDNDHKFRLKLADGRSKRIPLKKLYKLVYGKVFSKDNIEPLNNENWKEIEGSDGVYYVSDLGRIKSYAGYEAILLKPLVTRAGYLRLELVLGGRRMAKFVHRIVAAAWLPMPPTMEYQLHHIDFNKLNNAAANLQWVSVQQHHDIHAKQRQLVKEDQSQNDGSFTQTLNK